MSIPQTQIQSIVPTPVDADPVWQSWRPYDKGPCTDHLARKVCFLGMHTPEKFAPPLYYLPLG